MCIVKLHYLIFGKVGELSSLGQMLVNNILHSCADHKVLLAQTQELALSCIVVRIKNVGDGCRAIVVFRNRLASHIVEFCEVEVLDGLCLPKTKSVDVIVLVSYYRHIVRYCAYGKVLEADNLRLVFSADTPRIAPFLPIVAYLGLKTVNKGLLEKSVAIAKAVSVHRDIVGGCTLEIARRESAKTTVSKSCVFYLLKYVDIYTALCKRVSDLVKNAKIEQISKDSSSYQKLGGEISASLLRLLHVIVPDLRNATCNAHRNCVVKLFYVCLFIGSTIVSSQIAVELVQKFLFIKLHC